MTTDETHDRVVQVVAATRFPFPGQPDWPADYVTLASSEGPTRSIALEGGEEIFPDIVIVDGADAIREIGEVETDLSDGDVLGRKWQACSLACDTRTETGVRHFFVYVPDGSEQRAQALLVAQGISYAGLRSYRIEPGGQVAIRPITSPGGSKDHR